MKRSTLFLGSLALSLAGAPPAFAQTSPTAQPDPAATPAPMSDKDQAALTKCKAMTPVQVSQNSKCTKLMKEAGIKAPPKDPYANGYH